MKPTSGGEYNSVAAGGARVGRGWKHAPAQEETEELRGGSYYSGGSQSPFFFLRSLASYLFIYCLFLSSGFFIVRGCTARIRVHFC